MYDKIKAIASRYLDAKDQIKTEEATKHTLIMPFIAALGYDIFNPLEIVPEFVADIGIKKGEKIDYAIKHGEKISILIECKCCTNKLEFKQISQLFRYFHTCDACLGILSNGLEYQFFVALDAANKNELKRFSKLEFNPEKLVAEAREMKERAAVKNILEKYYSNPGENFVKCVLNDLEYQGQKTQQVVASYSNLVKEAYQQMVKEKVSARLNQALNQNSNLESASADETSDQAQDILPQNQDSVTTQEEKDAYSIIKAIACEIVSTERVVMRDAKSYCAILLDNNNRRTIVRLLFNNLDKLRMVLMTHNKPGETVSLSRIDDIYRYAEQIKNTIRAYEAAMQSTHETPGEELAADDAE